MGDYPTRDAFQARVKKLHILREKLCSRASKELSTLEQRDFVISELQDIHLELNKSGSTVSQEWCKERVEYILEHVHALPSSSEEEENV